MTHRRMVVGAVAVTLMAAFCDPSSSTAGKRAQDFSLPSARQGPPIHLADYAGKVVLINWWRTDCTWSQRESARLAALYQKHRDRGLVVLGISDDTAPTVSNVVAYLKRYNATWPVGLNDQAEFMREIRPLGSGETPENYLVSRSGEVTYLGLDRNDEAWSKLEAAVVAALRAPAPTVPTLKRRESSPAPAISLPDLRGRTVTLASFAGKPLVINFFNSQTCDWVGAVVAKLHQDFAARGLQVVGINLFDNDAQIQECIRKHGVKYPVLRGTQAAQQAWLGSSEASATFFVTADGKVSKAILNSIDNGIEGAVFPKYAEHLVAGTPNRP